MNRALMPLEAAVERFISGGTPSRNNEALWGGTIPWITGSDFSADGLNYERRFITAAAVEKTATNIVPKGAILLVTRTGVGKLAIAERDVAISQDVTGIVPHACVDANFLAYSIQRNQGYLLAAQRGATIKGVTRDVVRNLQVLRAPLSEQKRIAYLLDQAKGLCKLSRDAGHRAAGMLPALFLKMFGDPISNPMGWEIESLGSIGVLDRGKSRHRPRNDPRLLGGCYPFVQTGDVSKADGLLTEHRATYSEFGLAQSKLWPRGTLCITIAANIAETAILDFEACFPDSVVGFTAGPRTNSAFMRVLLGFLRPMLEASAPQAAQKNINLDILRELKVALPPISSQERFRHFHDEYLRIGIDRSHAAGEIHRLWELMLERAFSGELTAEWHDANIDELILEMDEQNSPLGLTLNS